ncbi:hypothetical protein HMPREF1624_07373 [Sporothrix schenckii ATCC 58251]|uniref:Mitochondrial outer membrane transport complex Sam37/metaxin N-terminal domain-containing protein n=1 Tax=Sporothrix schenckii (strain ATCC 58251 / de Perez 2211183) TaxID=1391915 RepID=U7PNG7_SPOS1|nr:hypothetical protein HMPREF1624_07373 [Sporothrix schenckii ATCC 58251]
MPLELHIWGPAFGLPSIDAECLAAVAYLSVTLPRGSWTRLAASPSSIPHPLPALRDNESGRWVAAGFDSIVAFVRAKATTDASITDLDVGLTPAQVADATAYSAFLRAEAAPLLALSFYVSSANWIAATRPAYSRILPFPLTWLEPPAIRASYAASAAHLGVSSLDTDNDVSDEDGSHKASSLAAALHVFPDRIRKSVQQQQQHAKPAQTAATEAKPAAHSLSMAEAASRVHAQSSSQTPEATVPARLDEAVRSCLSVLAEQKGAKRTFLRASSTGTDSTDSTDNTDSQASALSLVASLTSLDCLAWGYLALMTVPDVPRSFLRDTLWRHHPALAVFVADVRAVCFPGEDTALAYTALVWTMTVARPRGRYANPLWLRTLHGLVHSVPGLSGEWVVWLWRRLRVESDDGDDSAESSSDPTVARWQRDMTAARWQRLVTVSATMAGTALFVGLILGYRRLPAFGSRIVVYRRAPISFAGLGAAGALLSVL